MTEDGEFTLMVGLIALIFVVLMLDWWFAWRIV